MVSWSHTPYIVWTRQKKKNKCTYSVECRRDSPPDDGPADADDFDDDDDSLEEEKNRKLGCLIILLLSVVLCIPTVDDNLEEVWFIYCWWRFSRIIDGRRSNDDRIIVWEMTNSIAQCAKKINDNKGYSLEYPINQRRTRTTTDAYNKRFDNVILPHLI